MKRFSKILALFILACTIFSISLPVNASTAAAWELEVYGFDVPDTGYSYIKWSDTRSTVYIYHGKNLIGITQTIVGKAKSDAADSSGYHYEVLFVRSHMQPQRYRDTIRQWQGTRWVEQSCNYIGLNYQNRARMTLNTNQRYVDHAPYSTMPESSTTWSNSFGVSAGGSKSGAEFGFNVETGYSSTTKDNCITVSTYTNTASGQYDITYDYSVYQTWLFNPAAKKASNKWCSTDHKCYYAFVYKTAPLYGRRQQLAITIDSSFRYGYYFGSAFDGDCKSISGSHYDKRTTTLYTY